LGELGAVNRPAEGTWYARSVSLLSRKHKSGTSRTMVRVRQMVSSWWKRGADGSW